MLDESHIHGLVKNIHGCRAELVAITDRFVRLKINDSLFFWDRMDHWKPLDF
jgi:hypothetical protein